MTIVILDSNEELSGRHGNLAENCWKIAENLLGLLGK